jgi:exopolyphosphatase/guanosine-5'-triphosphate,3'-diphosphate pyrophosphatase
MAKYASIDIGSNTLLLLIADDAKGSLERVVDECDFGRLGQGMANSNRLHPDAIDRSMAIVKRYREILNEHAPLEIACVATQAIREAENRDDFVNPAQDLLGTRIEIIAGQREADLVARAVSNSFPELCEKELVVVDVGGGSTEFIHIKNQEAVSLNSIPIGAVRLSERYLLSDPPNPEETRQLFATIDEELKVLDLPRGVPVVGTAGTATTIASLKLKLGEYDPERIHGLTLTRSEVARTLASLLEATLAKKKQMRGLEPQRADVIAGGVAIYSRVLERLDSPSFVVCDRGVRWGLVYELAAS